MGKLKYLFDEVIAPVAMGAAMGVCIALALFYNV
jgi:hypothetical protein